MREGSVRREIGRRVASEARSDRPDDVRRDEPDSVPAHASVTTFVVDDEPLARRQLLELMGRVPWVRNLGEAADGLVAVEAINQLRPDVVFLDVEMPELSGLGVVERLAYAPAIVFTTAYDRYAVTAFELEAVDYLLKPFGQRRFLAALERARRVVEERGAAEALARARAVLATSAGPDAADSAAVPPLERILVRTLNGIVPVAVADVERFEADDDYVALYTRGRRHLVTARLGDLEARLDAGRFVRVHRSHIVNWDHVAALVPYDDVRLEVRMKDGTRILASRARSQEIRRMAQ